MRRSKEKKKWGKHINKIRLENHGKEKWENKRQRRREGTRTRIRYKGEDNKRNSEDAWMK